MTTQSHTIEISAPSALHQTPLVSVYMLAYQHERFIADAIEGVVAQKCAFPIELIIGEDCSPDNTKVIALDYQRRFPHIIRLLMSESNIGAKANNLRCRAAVRGAYVAICEGDDYWCDPLKLSRQSRFLAEHPEVSLVCHGSRLFDHETGALRGRVHTAFSSRILSQRELVLGDGGLIATASIMVRHEVLAQQRPWCTDAPISDYPLVLLASMMGKIYYEHRTMSVYRTNVPGSWSKRRSADFQNRWHIAQQMEQFLRGFERDCGLRYEREVRKMASKYYSDALVHQAIDRKLLQFHLEQVSSKLTWLDRLFARIAVLTGIRLGLVKTLLRKIDSAQRLLINELFAERFSDHCDFID